MYVLRIILVFVPLQMAKKGWLRNAKRENSKKGDDNDPGTRVGKGTRALQHHEATLIEGHI